MLVFINNRIKLEGVQRIEMEQKKISIISIFYNDKPHLLEILKSVQEQDYPNIEYIVIDGGSTDGSVQVLKNAEEAFGGKLRWISEKDEGIYDACNKGLRMMSGDYFLFLPDILVNQRIISRMMAVLKEGTFDGCHGGMYYVKNGRIIRRWSGKNGNWRFGWMPATPTLCLSRKIYENYGEFRTDYASGADYEYDIRFLKDGKIKLKAIKEPLILYQAGGVSNGGIKANLLGLKEGHRALKENGVRFAWVTDICRSMIAVVAYAFASRKKIDLEDIRK